MRRSKIVIPALVATAVLLGGAATSAASTLPVEPGSSDAADPEAQARVDAGLAALDQVATDAGYVGDGMATSIFDPIGVGSGDDPSFDCFADFTATVAEDGSFTGQLAGSASPTYYQTDDDTVPDDGSEFDLPQVEGSAAVLAEDALPAFSAMAEAFGTEELGDCLNDALEQLSEESDVEDVSIDITAEGLDIGDASSLMTLVLSGTIADEETTATTAFGLAVDGDAVAVVTVTAQSGDVSTDVVTDSLSAMVEAMAG